MRVSYIFTSLIIMGASALAAPIGTLINSYVTTLL
jgi:hypothetical protein